MQDENGSSPQGKAAQRNDQSSTPDRVLTVEEAAQFLRVNPKTIYDAIRRREIPHQRVGRQIRFCQSALIAWLSQGQGRVPRSKRNKS